MAKMVFREEQFLDDVRKGITADDDTLPETVESVVIMSSLPFAFKTLGWLNIPMGLYVAAVTEANLNLCDYFDWEDS